MRKSGLCIFTLFTATWVLLFTNAYSAPLLKMQFADDTVGSAPTSASAVQGGVSVKPTNVYVYTDTSILVRSAPIDSATNEMFEASKVVEILDNSTTYSPCIRFNGNATDVAGGSDKVRIDLDVMIDSTASRTGNMFVCMKQVDSNVVISQVGISLSSGKVSLLNYDATGTYLNSAEIGYATIGKSIHLQALLDYASGNVTVKADGLLYISNAALPGLVTKTGTFAKNISFGRLDILTATTATGKVLLDNITINAVPVLSEADVSAYGAVGNGVTDDTTSIQSAFNALGTSIGKLTFESGKTYLISSPLNVSSSKDFIIEGNNAVIKVKDGTPASGGSGVILTRCENFTIQNITVNGNRANRTPAETYAHNLILRGCRLFTLSGVTGENAVCDGFYVSAYTPSDAETVSRNGMFLNCKGDNCYRQGMSIINGHHLYVVNSEFSNTAGTAPEAGIDIEADSGTCEPSNMNIVIRNSKFSANRGYGTLISSMGATRNITIEDSYFTNSPSANPSLGGIGVCSEYSLFRNNFFEDYDGSYSQPNSTVTRGIIDLRSTGKFNKNNLICNNWFNHIATGQPVIYVHGDAGDYNEIADNIILDFDWNDSSGADDGIYVSVNNPTTILSGNRTALTPLGHWRLDEGSGTNVSDFSGNGLNGTTYNNPAWLPSGGYYAGALNFNSSSSQFVLLPDTASLDVTDHFTLSAWINPGTANDSSTHIVIGKDSNFSFGYRPWYYNDNFGLYSLAWGKWIFTRVPKGTGWKHVAATYNGCRVRLYVDGILVNEEVVKPGSIGTNYRTCIGSWGCTTYPFEGIIDDVRIYDVVLSNAAINDIKNNQTP